MLLSRLNFWTVDELKLVKKQCTVNGFEEFGLIFQRIWERFA